MDLKELAEPFPVEDVKWRVGSATWYDKGPKVTLLAYIDARDIMDRLDEVCGPENWRVRYTYEGGGVMCHLSILSDAGEWIEKSDGAEQTDIEKFKGGISDALKRAGNTWGIGRYLYGLGKTWGETTTTKWGLPNLAKAKPNNKEFWWGVGQGCLDALEALGDPKKSAVAKAATGARKAREVKKKSDAASAKPSEDVLLTAAQNKTIHALRRDVNLSDAAYHQAILRDYTAEKTNDLLKWQASEVIDRLKQRLKGKLDHEAKEAFGDDGGRVKSLRRMARGHCAKIRTGGDCYQNKEPIDYRKEGLPVDSLKDIEALIGLMSDEKELEGMIIRLEALLATITF